MFAFTVTKILLTLFLSNKLFTCYLAWLISAFYTATDAIIVRKYCKFSCYGTKYHIALCRIFGKCCFSATKYNFAVFDVIGKHHLDNFEFLYIERYFFCVDNFKNANYTLHIIPIVLTFNLNFFTQLHFTV